MTTSISRTSSADRPACASVVQDPIAQDRMTSPVFASGLLAGSARYLVTARWGGRSVAPFDTLNLADGVGDLAGAVQENRRIAATAVGVEPTRLALTGSVHGARVAQVQSAGVAAGCDAILTTEPGLALAALAADCVPVGLADVQRGVVSAVHCGWRGLVAGVVGATVHRMRSMGAEAVIAVVGPSICPRCYPVPAERVAQVRAGVSSAVFAAACPTAADEDAITGAPRIDVASGVRQQLIEAGVAVEMQVSGCTMESDALFSYRRDHQTGRHGLLITLGATSDVG